MPEDVFGHITPEDVFGHITPEDVFGHITPEDTLLYEKRRTEKRVFVEPDQNQQYHQFYQNKLQCQTG